MAKQILFNEEARRSLERGVNALADAVTLYWKRNSAHRPSPMTV